LKQELRTGLRAAQVAARARSAGARRAAGVLAALAPSKLPSPIALGIQGKGNNWKLAVRVQEISLGVQQQIDDITKRAKGEVDVRLIGYLHKQVSKPWHQKKARPLRIGVSVGHVDITAGTLGCFVSRNDGASRVLILSNNHVLANEDRAKLNDPILQPGPIDGGKNPRGIVAQLFRAIRLKKRSNRVDAAIAALVDGIEHDTADLKGVGKLNGVRTDPLDVGDEVFKVGRTTGLTRGRISAIEVDDVSVEYDAGILDFDGQVEIEPAENKPFSLGGDSGSLIVDNKRRAVGLLFAGNDDDSTYVNPIDAVLKALNVQLLF
jgi:hypothetical protein